MKVKSHTSSVFSTCTLRAFDKNVAEFCAKNIFHMKTENDMWLWFSVNLRLPQTNAHTNAVNAADSPGTSQDISGVAICH